MCVCVYVCLRVHVQSIIYKLQHLRIQIQTINHILWHTVCRVDGPQLIVAQQCQRSKSKESMENVWQISGSITEAASFIVLPNAAKYYHREMHGSEGGHLLDWTK